MLCVNAIPVNSNPTLRRLSLPEATIIVTIQVMANIEMKGIAASSHFNLPFNSLLNNNPATIGMMIILKISHIILSTSISINAPANNFMSNGVTNGASNVVSDVMVIDKARFAFDKYAITFEANPLGEQPMSTMPAAISGGKLVTDESVKPSNGIITNWLATPTITPFGDLTTAAKSFRLIDEPIPNMSN